MKRKLRTAGLGLALLLGVAAASALPVSANQPIWSNGKHRQSPTPTFVIPLPSPTIPTWFWWCDKYPTDPDCLVHPKG